MLLVVAWSARNAGAETQRWKARSTKMPGGSGGMQRVARARVMWWWQQREQTQEDIESRYSKETGEYAAVGGSRQAVVVEVVGGVSGSEQARA
jgi:hypothetical protein